MKNIFIYSRPVHSGKTTSLFNWIITKQNTDGILQPVIDNKRFLYHIASRQLKLLELENEEDENTFDKIGRYKFSKDAFTWAKKYLLESFNNKLEWLIIDEIGLLEMEGKGFEPVVSKIIGEHDKFAGNILFVVRDDFLQKVINHFQLKNIIEMFDPDLK